MSKFFLYKFLLVVCMVAYATNLIAQTSKIPIEIHIKDKEAIISIDGTPYPGGKGKHLYNIEVSSGKHTISATKPSHTVVSKAVNISSTNYASRIIQLSSPKPIYGAIKVSSEPTTLEVILDNKATGKKTPCIIDSILIGSYSITLKSEGYYDKNFNCNVRDADTTIVDIALSKKEVKTLTRTASSSLYSSSNSNYSSSTSSNSSTYSYYTSTPSKDEIEDKNFYIYYFGLGSGLLLNWEFQFSVFDFRYKWFEIRPCLWGVNLPFMQNISHTKLPKVLVDPNSYSELFDEYSMRVPERGAQVFYSPMLRFHVPLKNKHALVLGVGPQISWTNIYWNYKRMRLDEVSDYVMSHEDAPYSRYYKDNTWFTIEVAFLWCFDWGSDIGCFAKYQDGFYIGVEYRFGRKY